MKWQMKYYENEKMLYVKSEGEMSRALNEQMVKEAVSMQMKYNIRSCLVDHSSISNLFSTTEVYFQAYKLMEFDVPRNIHIAIVYPRTLKERFEFFETVCINQGYTVKVFGNTVEAKKWLNNFSV